MDRGKMLTPSVSVVIPALDEARNIPYVFAQMPADVYEVVLVDGFSVGRYRGNRAWAKAGCASRCADASGQGECACMRFRGGNR